MLESSLSILKVHYAEMEENSWRRAEVAAQATAAQVSASLENISLSERDEEHNCDIDSASSESRTEPDPLALDDLQEDTDIEIIDNVDGEQRVADDFLMRISCFFAEVRGILDVLVGLWKGFDRGEYDIMAVSTTTNAALAVIEHITPTRLSVANARTS